MQPQLKPGWWAVDPSLVPPNGEELWKGCALAWPLWQFGQMIAPDFSGNHLDGIFGSAILETDWVRSYFGPAVQFAGNTNDKITVADPASNLLDGFTEFTLEISFLSTTIGIVGVEYALAGKYRAFDGARSWRCYINGPEIQLQLSGDGIANEIQATTNASLVANTWYHLVVTLGVGGVFKVYLNGVLLTTDGDFSTQITAFGGGEEFKVGQRTTAGGGADKVLNGQIGDVRLWLRALTAAEALRLYEFPWEMYEIWPYYGALIFEHSGAAAPGPWVEIARVPAGTRQLFIPGLVNGMAYDVRLRNVDVSGNAQATGVTVTGTPAAPTGGTGPLRITLRDNLLLQPRARRGAFP